MRYNKSLYVFEFRVNNSKLYTARFYFRAILFRLQRPGIKYSAWGISKLTTGTSYLFYLYMCLLYFTENTHTHTRTRGDELCAFVFSANICMYIHTSRGFRRCERFARFMIHVLFVRGDQHPPQFTNKINSRVSSRLARVARIYPSADSGASRSSIGRAMPHSFVPDIDCVNIRKMRELFAPYTCIHI